MAKRPGASLEISDSSKWSLDQLRELSSQVDRELEQRALNKKAAKTKRRKQARKVANEKPAEENLAALEESLLREIQDYERGRKAGVIRV